MNMNTMASRYIREVVGVPLAEYLEEGTFISPATRLSGRRLGGSKGEIWDVEHRELGPLMVSFNPGTTRPDGTARCPARVANVVVRVQESVVARVLALESYEGLPYALLAPIEGRALSEILVGHGRLVGEEVVEVVSQVGKLLSTYHDVGRAHGDLRPETVFQPSSAPLTLLLLAGAPPTVSQATEQAASQPGAPLDGSTVDADADRWALGVLAYRLLTGVPPFRAPASRLRRAARPPSACLGKRAEPFDAWFSRAFARCGVDRYASAQEMADSLKQAVTRELLTPAGWSWPGAASLGALVALSVAFALGCWGMVSSARTTP
jgi:serine/threonine protein kinase